MIVKERSKRNGKKKAVLALILALLMVLGIIHMDFTQMRVKANYDPNYVIKVYEDLPLTKYKFGDKYSSGSVIVPKADGQYPVIIYLHGSDGPQTTLSELPQKIDMWTNAGYMDPAIVVLPYIDNIQDGTYRTADYRDFVKDNYLGNLLSYLKDDSDADQNPWKKKIDKTKMDTIMGYSMGASAALYGGITLPNVFKNIGAFSPSQLFYMNKKQGGTPGWHWVTDPSLLNFSNAQGAHMLLAYGLGEGEAYVGPSPTGGANRYYEVINANEKNTNKFLMYEVTNTDLKHNQNLFYRETFYYMYYLKYDELPSAALIEWSMGSVNKMLTGTVTLSGTAKCNNKLAASVSGCNSNESNLVYQWQRDMVDISGATSKEYVLGTNDAGHKIRCVVRDKTETRVGSIVSAETDKVAKADSQPTPTLTGTVTLSGNAIYLNQLGAYPTGYNCSKANLAYQWQRDGVNISGATEPSYILRADDIGHKMKCVVKDKTGTYTGTIASAETATVAKASGPVEPTGITTTPCTTGQKNGTIKNVTAKMEYSTNDKFNPAIACTGTEITNLSPGTYFIRVAATNTVGAGAHCYVTVREQNPDLQISKKSLRLQDTISIGFIVPKTAISGKYHDPYVVVTHEGADTKLTEYHESGDGYEFLYRVAPYQLGDKVTAVPYALKTDGSKVMGTALEYSVADYCYSMLGKEDYQGTKYATFRRLLVDILRYGDAAQTYMGYKTGTLAGRNLTSAQKAMGTDLGATQTYNTVKEQNYKTVSSADKLATIESAMLFLEASVNVRFRISANSTSDLRVVITDNADCTNVIAEYPLNTQQVDGGLYYVEVSNLNASQMKKTIYATVKKGSKAVSNTYRYSIESYVQSKKTNEGNKLDKLLDSMMRYGNSAADYVAGR